MAGVVRIVRDWLGDQLGNRITGTHDRPPSNLVSSMPLVVVTTFGGGDIDVNLSTPNLAVDLYAAGDDAASDLMDTIHALLRYRLRNYRTVEGHVVTTVRTLGLPRVLPYDSRNQVFRYGGTYQVWLKTRQPAF